MKKDRVYQNFVKKWDEVTALPQQTVGPLTPIYRRAVPLFKYAPWRVLMPVALFITLVVMFVLQITAVQVASLLQHGF